VDEEIKAMVHFIDRRLNGKNKSAVNRQRFIRRYKSQIKKAVSDAVAKRSIQDIESGENIRIPTKDITEPTFHQGKGGHREMVHPGNDRFVTGEHIDRPEGGGGKGGSGSGDASDSGEGADEVFGGYLYFHKAPDAQAFHEETVRKLSKLHLYDCLRANKSLSAWGVEGRVPFLDKEFLDVAMRLNPSAKMCPSKTIEKKIVRDAFSCLLPESVAWRQKEIQYASRMDQHGTLRKYQKLFGRLLHSPECAGIHGLLHGWAEEVLGRRLRNIDIHTITYRHTGEESSFSDAEFSAGSIKRRREMGYVDMLEKLDRVQAAEQAAQRHPADTRKVTS
jgi:hypothetical protein